MTVGFDVESDFDAELEESADFFDGLSEDEPLSVLVEPSDPVELWELPVELVELFDEADRLSFL